jgi:hypothetical protein
MTTNEHFPFCMALSVVPIKTQYLLPLVILMRIVPADRFGMLIDTDAASFDALTRDPLLTTMW